ncbi:MAG TPA: hypothetical protein VFU60_04160 [Ktedonobacterales bacterium]|nr:hypothetical protein [Ktedonobacterales bacterium]
MKWLEGWLGAVAGAMGLLLSAYSSLTASHTLNLVDVYSAYSAPGGGYVISPQWIRLLTGLPTITATALFAGALWGLWLDLNGKRAQGRVLLLGCSSIIILLTWFAGSMAALFTLAPAMPFAALAIVAGLIACLRRERQVDGAR